MTEHAIKYKDEIKLNDRAGDRNNPIAIAHTAAAEKAEVAVRNPRDVGIAPQARPEVG